jgi:DNA-binding MarR family transcriptional regulator
VKHGDHGRSRGRGEDETLADAFWSVVRSLRHASAESLARWEITPAQSRALRVLRRHGTMRLSELADHLRIAPRSATEVADDLEAKGIVRRLPDPHDRRATLVELTAEGIAATGAIDDARDADEERIFGRLTEQERAELTRILAKLREC